jgi:hypothetical protein
MSESFVLVIGSTNGDCSEPIRESIRWYYRKWKRLERMKRKRRRGWA